MESRMRLEASPLTQEEIELLKKIWSGSSDPWARDSSNLFSQLKVLVEKKEIKDISRADLEKVQNQLRVGEIIRKDGKSFKVLDFKVTYFELLKKGRISLVLREL
jgi:hypothetical protein